MPPAQNYVGSVGQSPLKAPAVAAFDAGANYTFEVWVYLPAQAGNWIFIMGKVIDNNADPYNSSYLQVTPDNRIGLATSDGVPGHGTSFAFSTASVPVGQWTHVAVAVSAGTTLIYFNGVYDSTGPNAGAPLVQTAVPFSLGQAFFSNGGSPNNPSFPGYIRQARFWNVTRSQAQIVAAMGQTLPSDTTGLVADWPLDESSGATARDISGNNYTLTAGSGAIAAIRTAVLSAQPFFATSNTAVNDGSLQYVNPAGALIDFNSDGKLDLLTAQGGPVQYPGIPERVRAFQWQAGAYVDVTDTVLGTVTMVAPSRILVTDFNGDGRADALVTGIGADTPPYPGEQSALLLQDASGHLVDVTATNLPQHSLYTHDATAGDIDGNGTVDIYLCNSNPGDPGGAPRFYLNNGSGQFSEALDRLPSDIADRTNSYTGCLLVDVNLDGFPDLVLGGWPGSPNSTNEILLNDGHGYFNRPAQPLLPPKLFGTTGTALRIYSADLNGDGRPDLVISTTKYYNQADLQVLLQQSDGTFADVTAGSGISWAGAHEITPVQVIDLNGDGKPDLVAHYQDANFVSRVRLLLNKGDGTFVDASDVCPAGPVGPGVFAADVNGDGNVDLVTPWSSGVAYYSGLKPLTTSIFYDGPLLSTQPAGQTIAAGSPFTLTVAATGNPPPGYQWQLNGVNIPGATGSSYTVSSADFANAGNYTVVAVNSAGTLTSLPAALTVRANFEYWVQTNFSTLEQADPAKSSPAAIFGQDGLSNLMKYSLGLNPKQNTPGGGFTLAWSSGEWIYTYSRPTDRSDLTYAVEVSTDLANWTTAGVVHEKVSAAAAVETWRGRYTTGATTVFFRLQVVH